MIVQKGNRQLHIGAQDMQKYLADGYDVVDERGRVIEAAERKSYPAAEVEKLKEQYEAEIAKLKKALKKEGKE